MDSSPRSGKAVDHVPSAQDLLDDLEPELIRAVPLHACLRDFGSEWRPTKGHRDGAQRGRGFSRVSAKFDHFLSHDWQTSGWLKYFSLLIFFNGTPAALAATTVGLGFSALRAAGVFSESWGVAETWMLVFGHVVSLLVLFFWQHVKIWWPTRVFLDRMCIPQDDPGVKAQCIYGLASFLNRSEKVLLLWSPRYFSRLWCMYELSTFLMKRKSRKIQVLPVQVPILWLLTYTTCSVYRLVAFLAVRVGYESMAAYMQSWVAIIPSAIQALVLWPFLLYYETKTLRELAKLPDQLQAFRLQSAACSCCAFEHRHPVTGKGLACDRQLIYGALQTMLQPGEKEDVDAINNHVQQKLVPSIMSQLRPSEFLLRHLVTAVVAGFAPALCDLDVQADDVIASIGHQLNVFLVMICARRLSFELANAGANSIGRNLFVLVAGQVATLSILTTLWILPFYVVLVYLGSSAALVPLGLLLVLSVWLFRPRLAWPAQEGEVGDVEVETEQAVQQIPSDGAESSFEI
mmetsp:Transcript_22623/g.52354  ORF Transcript_22623/g.52354 Transcript_22623/m.52354 type:complete len:517 (+) Transcript_22623:62-1612(+)